MVYDIGKELWHNIGLRNTNGIFGSRKNIGLLLQSFLSIQILQILNQFSMRIGNQDNTLERIVKSLHSLFVRNPLVSGYIKP